MHWRPIARRTVAGCGLTLALLAPAGAAAAQPPVDVPPGERIVDEAGVLEDPSALAADVRELATQEGITLTAVFVDSFTDPSDPDAWLQEFAEVNDLGSSDAVLVVATEDRQQRFSAYSTGPLSTEQQERINRQYITPALAADDWDGAVEGAVEGIEAELSGAPAGAADSSDGGGAGFGLLGLGALGLGGLAVYGMAARNKKRRQQESAPHGGPGGRGPAGPGRPPEVPVPELRKRAGELLVATDNAIQHSEQELAFAQLQYGDEQVEPFRRAVQDAKKHMQASFALQQQLEDHIPDTEEQQRAWLGEIIARSQDAQRPLQEHQEAFSSLRRLESRAPQALEDVRRHAEAVRPRVATADARLRELTAHYNETAVAPVRDNIDQARDRLDFVDTALEEARTDLAAGRTSDAVLDIRAAEEGAGQAGGLLDAVEHAATELAHAEESLKDAVTIAQRDVAEADALVRRGSNPELAGAVAGVGAVLRTVEEQMGAGRIDPLGLSRRLAVAKDELDKGLASVRSQNDRDRSARETLAHTLVSAQAQLSSASEYIWARRGGVGPEARTRLAEAERCLEAAQQARRSDPSEALTYANEAVRLAGEAQYIAQRDVDSFSYGGFGTPVGMGGHRGRSNSGLGGAMLGGILLGSILNGGGGGFGGGGGGFGGSFGGGFGGGGGGFGGGIGGSF
ncbi:TPM domain-containing protein [Kocuria sp. CH-021]|uniref:TPM domain-containing protein n=1 Tax=Kocuria sp. CH-021 TaxID=3406735 RepID=UPI003C732EEC